MSTRLRQTKEMGKLHIKYSKTNPTGSGTMYTGMSDAGRWKLIVDDVVPPISKVTPRYRVYGRPSDFRNMLTADGKERKLKKTIFPMHDVEVRSFSSWASQGTLTNVGYVPGNYTKITFEGPIAACARPQDVRYLDNDGHDLADLSPAVSWDYNIAREVLTKAYNDMGRSDASLSITVFKTIAILKMITNPLKALAKGIASARLMYLKGLPIKVGEIYYNARTGKPLHPKMVKRLTRAAQQQAADNYLVYNFGWRNLVRNINDALYTYAKEQDAWTAARVSKARKYALSKTYTYRVGSSYGIGSQGFQASWVAYRTDKVYYTAKCYYKMGYAKPPLWDYGLDIYHVWQGVWDWIPWSFVVDWFGDISSWITRMSMNHMVSPLGNCVTKVTETRIRYECDHATCNARYAVPPTSSHLYVHRRDMKRMINQSPAAYPQFFSFKFSESRVFSIIALAVQQILRFKNVKHEATPLRPSSNLSQTGSYL